MAAVVERTVIAVKEIKDDYTRETTYRYTLTCGHKRSSVVPVECGDIVFCLWCKPGRA